MRICSWNILLGLRLNAVLDAVSSLPDFRELDLFALQEASIHDGKLHSFVFAKSAWSFDTSRVQGAHEMHPILSRLRDQLAST